MNSDHPSVYAYQATLSFKKPLSDSELKSRIDQFLLRLGRELAGPGSEILGHVKGLLNTPDGEHVMFSLTSLTEGVQSKGKLSGSTETADFTVNIILYGIGTDVIEAVFKEIFNLSFSDCSIPL